jgi:hypothetical protein
MPLALLVSLLLLISTAVLLYQFWTGALVPAEESDAAPRRPQHIERPMERAAIAATPPAPTRRYRVDSAA